jgi:predicted nuclease of predicted toxin-antitoxin system
MRWLADECVDAVVVVQLRRLDHDVIYAAETASSAPDSEIISLADQQRRLLLTEDKDFGELVFRKKTPVPGLVLVRIEPEKRGLKWPRLEAAIARFGNGLCGRFTVVEAARFRVRPLLVDHG